MAKPKAKKKKTASRKEAASADACPPEQSPPTVRIAAAPMKVAEPRDHLQQRSKWFGARSGKK